MSPLRGTSVISLNRHEKWLKMSHLAFNTTTRCQQRCVYCFEGARKGKQDLDKETVRERLRSFSKKGQGIVFMGAEPTMNPDIVSHIAYAKSLGLDVALSTNALKFGKRAFLDTCISAGMSSVEVSFPYPDAAVYSTITRLNENGFAALLQALENINAANRGRSEDAAEAELIGVNANCVVSKFNHSRLTEVLDRLEALLRDTPFLVTMKMIGPTTEAGKGMARFLDEHYVPLRRLREDFTTLLKDWRYDFPIIFRGYPLCVIPEFEDLAFNLAYHSEGRNSHLVEGNIDADQNVQRRLHAWELDIPQQAIHSECLDCSLEAICLERRLLTFDRDDPDNSPILSDRMAEDVLITLGHDETSARILLSFPTPMATGVRDEATGRP